MIKAYKFSGRYVMQLTGDNRCLHLTGLHTDLKYLKTT